MEIEINNIKYKKKYDKQKEHTNYHSLAYVAMKIAFGMQGKLHKKTKRDEFIPLDYIINEFKLIQDKKSNLTRSKRNEVIFQFNDIFEIAE